MFTMIKKKVETTKPMWTIESEKLMIDLYKYKEHLWNFRSKHYYNRNLRERSFLRISKQLGHDYKGVPYTPTEIKEKIKNMRATFGRELVKHCNSKKMGAGELYTPTWKHFDRMQFLKVARVTRKKKEYTTTDQELEKYLSDNDEEHLDMYCEVEFETKDETNDTQLTAEENTETVESTAIMAEAFEPTTESQESKLVLRKTCSGFEQNKRPRQVITSLENTTTVTDDDNISNMLTTSTQIDGEFHFCMSLAENLRKMNPFHREIAKVEIQKVMIKFMFPYAETDSL